MEQTDKVRYLADQNRELKVATWAEGEVDMPPKVMATFRNGQAFIGIPGDRTHVALMAERADLATLLFISLDNLMHDIKEPFRTIVFTTEGFFSEKASLDDIPKRGQLQRDFSTNPATEVKEGILTLVAMGRGMPNECDIFQAHQTFVRVDGGGLAFDEMRMEEIDESISGDIPEMLRFAFRHASDVADGKDDHHA